MLRPTPISFRSSPIKKPRSAMTEEPGTSISSCSNPDFWVYSMSEILAINKSEIKDTAPLGVHAIRNMAVLWCLYDDYVELCR